VATHENKAAINDFRDGCPATAVYSTVEDEYRCVRERVGLQDLSHYGKISVTGDDALALINHFIPTDLERLPINQLQSSFILADDGRPVCELLIANFGTHYLLLTEGAPAEDIEARLKTAAAGMADAAVDNLSESLGLLSVDGPYAWELLKSFLGLGIIGTRYLEVVPEQMIGGVQVTLCRAGKTGEYGYMLLAPAAQIVTLWSALKTEGERFGALPIGTRVADLCKMENRNVSQHQEGAMAGNVLELNTRTMLGRDKADYVGKAALQTTIANGVERRLVGMTFDDALSVEQDGMQAGVAVNFGEHPIGKLVNVGYSFALKRWIGLALIDEAYACVGVNYAVGDHAVRTVSAPFLFNRSLTIRPQEDSYFT